MLEVHDLSFYVPLTSYQKLKTTIMQRRLKVPYKLNRENKTILKNINLQLHPGEFTAMIGPSGSGKTTLLNLMANRIYTKTYTGSITLDGIQVSPWVKKFIGYVQYEDVLYPFDTPREAIEFYVKMKLKSFDSAFIDRVISVLGLERVQNDLTGSAAGTGFDSTTTKSGLSGGERRRVSIAREIVTASKVLLLDECTSGLDVCTAEQIIKVLKEISLNPYDVFYNPSSTEYRPAICATLHQPSYAMWPLIDRIIVLRLGEIVYDARTSDFERDMSAVGLSPQVGMNPADYLISLISGEDADQNVLKLKQTESLPWKHAPYIPRDSSSFSNSSKATDSPPTNASQEDGGTQKSPRPSTISVRPSYSYKNTDYNLNDNQAYASENKAKKCGEKANLHKLYQESRQKGAISEFIPRTIYEWFFPYGKYTHGYFFQFWELYKRSLKFLKRNPSTIFRLVGMYAVSALFCGTLYWRQGTDLNAITNKVGALFFILLAICFGPAGDFSIRMYQSKMGYLREHASGLYGTKCYYLSQFLVDLPINLICVFGFCVTAWYMVGFNDKFTYFLLFYALTVMTLYSVIMFSLFFMNMCKSYVLAVAIFTVTLAILIMFSGSFIKIDNVPSYWIWMTWVSPFTYLSRGFIHIIFHDMPVTCSTPPFCLFFDYKGAIDYLGFGQLGYSGSLWLSFGYITGWTVLWYYLSYVALRYRRFY